jgi:DNA-binding NarL/FixJ family response regulator
MQLLLLGGDLLFRQALEKALAAEPDMAVMAACGTGAEALSVLGRERVDLVLLDLDDYGEGGFRLLATCRASGWTAKILILTRGLDPVLTVRALQLGVAGIFVKRRGLEVLRNALRVVNAGEAWLEPDAIRLLADGVKQYLMPNEEVILQGVLDGLTNAEIATRTALAERAVKAALQRLYQKAGVRTRGQLIRAAMEGALGARK